MSKISWYQKARLRAIETLAFWRGRINSRDLTETFGISRVVALGDIHRYMEQAPGNLIYRRSDKAYFATSIFKNQFTSGVIDEWMTLDSSLCEYVEKPQFEIKPELARPLIQAIHKGTGVTVMYRSMEHPGGTERSLFPHTLVYSGFRWHVRAWCCVRKGFRDFNLSRISRVTPLSEEPPPESVPNQDELWNMMVDIRFMANPGMSEQERSLIEAEFSMVKGQLKITTRASLAMYTLQAYQVDPDQEHDIYKQRLVLANPDDIAPFLW
ncbi:MAG: WYL domain-containing protein [Candidatus Thiodiazotropha endolucinida]